MYLIGNKGGFPSIYSILTRVSQTAFCGYHFSHGCLKQTVPQRWSYVPT